MTFHEVINKLWNSKLVRGFVATFLGSGTSKAILVLGTFIFTNTLNKNDFGEFSFVRTTLNTLLCMCALNFSSLCTKFTVESKDSNDSVKRLALLFLFSIVVSVIAGAFLFLMPDRILLLVFMSQTIVDSFRVIGLFFPIFILQPLIEGVFRGLMRFKLIGIMQTLSALFFVVSVYFGIRNYGIKGALVGIIIYYFVYALASIVTLLILNPLPNLTERIKDITSEKTVIRQMVLPIFFMSFFEAPILWISQILLAKYDSMSSIGSMTAILQIRNFIILIPSYFIGTFLAFASEMNAKNQYDAYFKKFNGFGKAFFIAGCTFFIIFSVLSKPILNLYGAPYAGDWPAMLVSNLGIPIIMLISLLRVELVIQEHQKQLMYISIFWNIVWLCTLFIMLESGMLPLIAFFVSQLIGWIINLILFYMIYKKDKEILIISQ